MNSPGVSRRKMVNSGVSSSGSAFIKFDEVQCGFQQRIWSATNARVSKSSCLVRSLPRHFHRSAANMLLEAFAHERLWVDITALHLRQVAHEDAYQHALKRNTFGKPPFENQVIRQKFPKPVNLMEPIQAFVEERLFPPPCAPRDSSSLR